MIWRAEFGALTLGILFGCADLTRPASDRLAPPAAAEKPAPAPEPPSRPVAEPDDAPTTPPRSNEVGASHILVAYRGAARAKPDVERNKQQARKRAQELLAEARKPGADFAKLAREASDGPSGSKGGALGRFTRRAMVKPFSDAAFALKPGEVSGVVETQFGFHIIKRTE